MSRAVRVGAAAVPATPFPCGQTPSGGSKKPKERWKNIQFGHELYCAGHLIEAAVAYHQATGKRKLLDVAARFADHICATFGPGRRVETCGHEEIELALVKLYRATDDAKYLRRYGATNVKSLHTRDRKTADDPKFSEVLLKAGGVWFGGSTRNPWAPDSSSSGSSAGVVA